jgi:transcriptional regulator
MLVLKILELEPLHGYGLTERLEQITDGTFQVNPGSLFPALHRMEQRGWLESRWDRTENNRRAKFYRLTRAGRRQLRTERESWKRLTLAIDRVLEAT